jgi:FlaA1/EpsC-like NDP-sugar epimerase
MSFFRQFRRVYLMVLDALLVNLAVLAALYLRFEFVVPRKYIDNYLTVAPFFTVAALGIFAVAGLYSWILRYASIDALLAAAAGGVGSGAVLWCLTRYWVNRSFPRSVPVIAAMLVFLLVGGMRLSVRLFMRLEQRARRMVDDGSVIRVLVAGAGDAGAILGRELAKTGTPQRKIVGYIDDDPAKKGSLIYGVRVLGPCGVIPSTVQELGVQEVIIAMPSAPPEVTRAIVEVCQGLRVKIRSLPRLVDLAGRNFDLAMVKEIDIEDLLGRPEVKLETDKISEYLAGKKVLVTGAGGSIGSEICRQAAAFKPSSLIILGHGENAIFAARMALENEFPGLTVETIIADVRDSARIRDIFAVHRPNVVFHAAAHKHVPLMEENLTEALKTNVFGTLNVARAALRYESQKFVMISTDKAVNPTSVMGVSKRIAEMVVRTMNDPSRATCFVSVRFGNVLGSSGSVVPIFKEQIARGGPVTVTHPEMERYFMTVKEAVQLVLQAGTMGKGGEILVLDMGKPVKIVDLAEQMIKLSGRIPYTEVPIVFSGVRPGEKLFEELLTAEEGTTATNHSQIFIAKQNGMPHTAFLEKLARLEREVFPRDYQCRLFGGEIGPSAAGAAGGAAAGPEIPDAAADGERDALSEVAKGLQEVAISADPPGEGQSPGIPERPLEAGRYWGPDRDRLVLMSREKQILAVLKEIVPAYGPSRARKGDEGSSAQA